jgi:uncharacterized protein (DUF697 family)
MGKRKRTSNLEFTGTGSNFAGDDLAGGDSGTEIEWGKPESTAVSVMAAEEPVIPEPVTAEPASVDPVEPYLPARNFIIHARVDAIIKSRSLLAAGLGIVPVPVFNLISVTVIQINMVQAITRLYDVEVKKSWIKNVIASVLGGCSATGIAGLAVNGLRAAPLVGSSLAVLSAPVMNGLTTYALGYMFARYFESPDGFLKTNIRSLGEWFKEGFKEGREKLGTAVSGKAPAF